MSNFKENLKNINSVTVFNDNANLGKIWKIIYLGIFSIQLVLFFIYLLSYYIARETPIVVWDSFDYYKSAVNIFQQASWSQSFQALQNSNRPAFSWLIIFLIKFLGLNLNYGILSLVNAIFYHVVLVASICYLLKSIQANFLTIIATISILYSTPILFNMSTVLMGDVAVAAWVMLFIAALVAIQKPSHRLFKSFIIGIIAAFGFQTKPIFIFCLVIFTSCFAFVQLSCSIFFNKIPIKNIFGKIFPSILVSFISFCCSLYFIYPLKLSELIAALSYNNETLGYWISASGIFNSWLWFPKATFDEINILTAFVLSLIFIGKPVYNIINSPLIKTRNNIFQSLRRCLREILFSQPFFIQISFLLSVVYVSFFVQSKDARVLFFLIPLFITLSLSTIDSIAKLSKFHNRIANFLLASILIANLSNIASWSPLISSWIPSQFFNKYWNIEKREFAWKSGYFTNPITYESLGIQDVFNFLEKDCQQECLHTPSSVFLTHSSYKLNDTTFISFKYVMTNLSNNTVLDKSSLNFTSAPFNYGGWGYEGGIPRMFFKGHYVVVMKDNNQTGGLVGNTEVYNRVLADNLSSQKLEFLDGLTPAFKVKNALGDIIFVYKRQKLPSPENFVKIVQNLVTKDPDNLWNIPFIYSALQINPQIPELKQQLEKMSEVIKTSKYRFGTPQQEAKIRDMLTTKKNINKYEFKYPEFLTEWY